MSSTQTLDRFLAEISTLISAKNSVRLQEYLIIEPPYSQQYQQIVQELRTVFPKGSEEAFEQKCNDALPIAGDGEDEAPWTAFLKFMVQYFVFLRDVNVNNLLETFTILSELVQ